MKYSKSAHTLQFRESYFHNFAIPMNHMPALSYYKRLNWSAKYFLAQWSENIDTYAAGTIRRYNQINHVQFCKGCSIGKIKHLLTYHPDLQLDLSFRKAEGLPAFVLVDFRPLDKQAFGLEQVNETN